MVCVDISSHDGSVVSSKTSSLASEGEGKQLDEHRHKFPRKDWGEIIEDNDESVVHLGCMRKKAKS